MNDLPLDLPAALPDSRAIRQRSWIKRMLPTTMFGLSAARSIPRRAELQVVFAL